MKFPASTPRVVQSPIPEPGEAVAISGKAFEDGKRRVVVGRDVSPEFVAKLEAALDDSDREAERVRSLVAVVNDLFSPRPARPEPPAPEPEPKMRYPMQCRRCGNVHDGATVTIVQRYTDCSVWRCPGCGTLIDDRPAAWGGSAERVSGHA